MIPLSLPRSRSSTSSSCGYHELSSSTGLLSPMDADSSKHHAGRRLSRMRHKISSTLSKSSYSQYPPQAADHTQTLPVSRPKIRRAISRSMIAPLQHLFGADPETEAPERHETPLWSPTLPKPCSTIFSRRVVSPHSFQRSVSDDDEWDFRCQGMAPIIPARPSEDALSPASAYDPSLLSSPGFIGDGSFATSSGSSCCSSPGTRHAVLRSFSADNTVKKQKISVDSISGPLNLWARSPSPLLAPPTHRKRNQLGLEVKT